MTTACESCDQVKVLVKIAAEEIDCISGLCLLSLFDWLVGLLSVLFFFGFFQSMGHDEPTSNCLG